MEMEKFKSRTPLLPHIMTGHAVGAPPSKGNLKESSQPSSSAVLVLPRVVTLDSIPAQGISTANREPVAVLRLPREVADALL